VRLHVSAPTGPSSGLLTNQVDKCWIHVGIQTMFTIGISILCLADGYISRRNLPATNIPGRPPLNRQQVFVYKHNKVEIIPQTNNYGHQRKQSELNLSISTARTVTRDEKRYRSRISRRSYTRKTNTSPHHLNNLQ
jgi:hypothetical protein